MHQTEDLADRGPDEISFKNEVANVDKKHLDENCVDLRRILRRRMKRMKQPSKMIQMN